MDFSLVLPTEVDLLSLYVPILISFLTEESESLLVKRHRLSLHSEALRRLLVIAPQHPQDFRSIVSQLPRLKSRLETAIRKQHQVKTSKVVRASDQLSISREAAPAIQLKTDFSNFATPS